MPLKYRQNVCMLLYRPDFQIWLGRRVGRPEIWQLPQGGVEANLPLAANALRELEEELGVQSAHLGLPRQLKATHRYDWAEPPRHWKHKFRGQEQTFWVVPYLGRDSDIRVNQVEHPEFSDWRWAKAEQVEDIVEEVRRPGYRRPIEEFIELRQGSRL